MFFVFEKIVKEENKPVMYYNFTNCDDVNLSGHSRFHPSPVVFSLLHKFRTGQLKNIHAEQMIALKSSPLDEEYIIPVGVAHSPEDWCGPCNNNNLGFNEKYPNRKNLFEHLNEEYLQDLQNGRAYLLIDQTHEGYHNDWLFQWFHISVDTYGIPANKIIYLTGDMKAAGEYKKWADICNLHSRLKVVGWPHFETVIYDISSGYHGFDENFKYVNDDILPPGLAKRKHFPKLKDQIQYKKDNLDKIKTFDILQKRTRLHRIYFYKFLHDAGLINDNNIVSMNMFSFNDVNTSSEIFDEITRFEYDIITKDLPILPFDNPKDYEVENFTSSDGANYILYLNDQTMLNSFCSVISEVFYDDKDPCFISEKTFKPIACSQPFIILSTRGFLTSLRELGYKTFHPYIDESYDDYDELVRIRLIIMELVRISNFTQQEKLEWYLSMQDILQHNFENFNKRQKHDNVYNIIEKLKLYTEEFKHA